jgi:hypothetical protein
VSLVLDILGFTFGIHLTLTGPDPDAEDEDDEPVKFGF